MAVVSVKQVPEVPARRVREEHEGPPAFHVENTSKGCELVSDAALARGVIGRAAGLLGRKSMGLGEGLILVPCSSVHTWFMRFPIDVVFVNRNGVVTRVCAELDPYHVAASRGARAVLELPAGWARQTGTEVGDRLAFRRGLFPIPLP